MRRVVWCSTDGNRRECSRTLAGHSFAVANGVCRAGIRGRVPHRRNAAPARIIAARHGLAPRRVTVAGQSRRNPMPIDARDPTTWPPDTIVVRCGSAQGVHELAERLSRDGSWSVFTGAGVPFPELVRSCRNNQVRRTTVGAILTAGGSLRPSSGRPHHHDLYNHDLYGLTPQQFDAILGLAEPNPVQKPDRWTPS